MVFPLWVQLWEWNQRHICQGISMISFFLISCLSTQIVFMCKLKMHIKRGGRKRTYTWKYVTLTISSKVSPTFKIKYHNYVIMIYTNNIYWCLLHHFTHISPNFILTCVVFGHFEISARCENKPLRVWTKSEQRNTFVSGGFKRLKHESVQIAQWEKRGRCDLSFQTKLQANRWQMNSLWYLKQTESAERDYRAQV